MTEEDRWLAAKGGDPDAFGFIFDLHRHRVYRHALHHVASGGDAEDAVAVAFLTLWSKRRSVRLVEGSVLPWLLATTTHAARNLNRSRRRYESLLNRLPRETVSSEDPAEIALAHLDATGRHAELARAIRSLSDADAMLIALIAIEGFSTEQTGAALGISSGAARTRLHRLRRKLAQSLTQGTETVSS